MFVSFTWRIPTKLEIAEQCKGVHCVDLYESFQTHIYLQNLASIRPRTSPRPRDEVVEVVDEVQLADALEDRAQRLHEDLRRSADDPPDVLTKT